jgi:hypothetical protein
MNNYVLIVGALSLFLFSAALAQHGGTEQEQRACASTFRGTAVRYWIKAISLCWPASSNTGKSSPRLVEKFLTITVR